MNSKQIYQEVRSSFADMMQVSVLHVKLNKLIPHWKRREFALCIEKKFDIIINYPESLTTISAFAEYIKVRERSVRIPQIREIVKTQVLIFAPNSQSDDEPYFANYPTQWKKDIIKPINNRLFQLFKTPWYGAGKGIYPFDHEFSFNELVEWIYQNEKI